MEKPIRSNVESSRLSVIEILMAHSLENTGKLPDLNYLTAEAFTFIDAGVDTAGRTLAAAVYFVLRDQTVQRKLQEELDSLSVWDSGNTEQIVRSVGKLPFLVSSCRNIIRSGSLVLTILSECGHQRGASYMAVAPGATTSRCAPRRATSRVILHSKGRMLSISPHSV